MQNSDINQSICLQHAWLNRLQTLLLFTFMGGFLSLLGWLLWGGAGVIILLIVSFIFLLINPSVSPRLVMRLYGASFISPPQAPSLYTIVTELARRAELQTVPNLYYIPSRMVNAFTVGHSDQSVIAVTDGLLRSLDTREKIGVLAHEISHIRTNDLRVMSLADMFSRLTGMLSLFGQFILIVSLPLYLFSLIDINWLAILILIFAPSISALAQLGLSRVREYDADLNAALLSGDPEGLARALEKIEYSQYNWLQRVLMPGRQLPEPSLLRTHPPTEERIRRLMQLKTPRQLPPIQLGPDISTLIEILNREAIRRPPRRHISGLWH